jgi:REP element-mobilizing transposase RayT
MNKYKRLNHHNDIGQYQFITFRTKDSIDPYIKGIYSQEKLTTAKKEYLIDQYQDNSSTGAYLYGEAIGIFRDVLFSYEAKGDYSLESFAIMPNHIHVLLRQDSSLSDITKSIKASSSFKINRHLNRSGALWSKYYFDTAIRDEKHFDVVCEYVLNNPIKAGLRDSHSRVWSKYGG